MEVLSLISRGITKCFRVTYKVLLHVDEGDVVLREELSEKGSVGVLVSRDIVSIENRRKTSDVACHGVELARRLGKHPTQKGELNQERAHHDDCWKL
jgi:hypothetical protein